MREQPLTCKEVVELVTEYLEGAMPAEEKRRFEEHLALCPGCGTYLGQMRQTIDLLGKLPEEAIPPDAQNDLLFAFRDWKRRRGLSGGDQA